MAGASDRFEFELALIQQGKGCIAGVDEVGRGPLAGPVVAAAVVLPREWILGKMPEKMRGLNDSKQLSESRRVQLHDLLLCSTEVLYGIAQIESEEIDQINILQATHKAMVMAIGLLGMKPEHVLVDGLPVSRITLPQTSIIKGDARSYSIAAASILAKVSRDRLMSEYDQEFPGYGFAAHKGYGTSQHLNAIHKLGPCRIHRKSFAPFKDLQRELF